MNNKLFYFVIILLIDLLNCSSQTSFIIQKVEDSPFDISMANKLSSNNLLDSIKVALRYNYCDSAYKYIQSAEKSGRHLAYLPRLKAEQFERLNKLDSAKNYYEKALELAQNKSDSSQIFDLNTILGYISFELKNYPLASKYFESGNRHINNKVFGSFLKSFTTREPFKVKTAVKSTKVKIVDINPFPKVDVTVNGIHSNHFIFDTGCNFICISSRMAKKCGIISCETVRSGWQDLKGKDYEWESVPMQFTIIDSLKLGNFTIYNIPAVILDHKKMSFRILGITLYKLEGAIGIPIMKEFKTTVNYNDKEITFELPDNDKSKPEKPNMMICQNVPYVHVDINEGSGFNFFIDSGAKYSAVIQKTLSCLDSTRLYYEKSLRDNRDHVGARFKIEKDILPQKFIIGGYGIDNFRLEVLPKWEDTKIINQGIIARDVLDNFITTYDFQNMRFDLEPIKINK
jgi:tetratricopeptide (TPR) repeat protein